MMSNTASKCAPMPSRCQHLAGMVGRAVGQDQLAPGQLRDRRAHRRVRLAAANDRSGAHRRDSRRRARRARSSCRAWWCRSGGNNPSGSARASSGGYLEPGADEFADPRIDLLPQIDVMRIQRVVEIEHPGVDMVKGRGFSCLNVVPARTIPVLGHSIFAYDNADSSRHRKAQRLAAARHVDGGKAGRGEAAACRNRPAR